MDVGVKLIQALEQDNWIEIDYDASTHVYKISATPALMDRIKDQPQPTKIQKLVAERERRLQLVLQARALQERKPIVEQKRIASIQSEGEPIESTRCAYHSVMTEAIIDGKVLRYVLFTVQPQHFTHLFAIQFPSFRRWVLLKPFDPVAVQLVNHRVGTERASQPSPNEPGFLNSAFVDPSLNQLCSRSNCSKRFIRARYGSSSAVSGRLICNSPRSSLCSSRARRKRVPCSNFCDNHCSR